METNINISKKSYRLLFIGIFVGAFFTLIVGGIFGYFYIKNINRSHNDLLVFRLEVFRKLEDGLNQTISELNKENEDTKTMLDETRETLTNANDKLFDLETNLNNANKELEIVETRRKKLSEQVASLETSLRESRTENRNLEELIACTDRLDNLKYSSNSSASSVIKEWLQDKEGKINEVSWDVIWNNSKTTIHYLTGEYLYVYIVYFNEPDLSFGPAIFDVGENCWLAR